MQLGKPEPLGVLYQDNGGVRDVHAHLYDGCGDQYIELPVLEVPHYGLFLRRLHPPVKEPHVKVGKDVSPEVFFHVRRVFEAQFLGLLDKGVYYVALAPGFKLPPYKPICPLPLLFPHDAGEDGLSSGGQFVDNRYVEVAEYGHGQRPRYWGGGHDKYVGAYSPVNVRGRRLFLQSGPLRHPEAVLLVYYGKPQPFKLDVFLYERVRAYYEIGVAGPYIVGGLPFRRPGHAAGQKYRVDSEQSGVPVD